MIGKLIIFDLDGTLIDTIGDLAAAVEHSLAKGGFPGPTIEDYRSWVGHGIRNLVTRSLPVGSSETTVDETLREFVSYYSANIDVLSRPYQGIPGLLATLTDKGFKLAVASNKFQEGAEKLMQRFFPDIPFVKIIGNAPGLPLKPDPEVVRLAIAAAGSTGKALLIGDSATDIKTAHNAGIPAVAVSWGFRPREDLLSADAIADDTSELYRIINEYF